RYKARCTGWIDTGPPWYISIPIGMNVLNAFFCEISYNEGSESIDITSPSDTTYTSPMEGYYPGSYGFEEDDEGTYGTDISFLNEWTGNMEIFLRMYVRDGPYDGHNKVLEIFDSQSSGTTTGVHYFDNPPISGTIEFWLYMNDGYGGSDNRFHEIHFRKSDDTIAFRAQLKMLEASGDRADIAYWDGNDWVEFADCVDETWYHHTITFDCSGNGKFTWTIANEDRDIIALISDIPFENSMNTLDEIYFTSIRSHYRGSTYWDAFGFSWEDDYNVGDNFKEGVLLDFEPDDLDQICYVLDGQDNVYIRGDTVIPMPNIGEHYIQVFGYSDDIFYQSELCHFTAGVIKVHSPLGVYTDPMEGYYPATYGFESEVDNTFPQYMINDGSFPIKVKAEKNGHNKVLWFDDNGYSYRADCHNNFNSGRNRGTIEFWFLVSDASDRTGMQARQGTSNLFSFGSRYDKWKYATATEIDLNIQKATGGDMESPLDNTWHHIRIDFECRYSGSYMGLDQYTWKCWIDGVESAEMPFSNNIAYADNFHMGTSSAHQYYDLYIDALGYSWDNGYDLGNNRKEGILLDFEPDNLEDMYYIYDREDFVDPDNPVDIFGDTVIPFPSVRDVLITVYGKYNGEDVKSETLKFQFGSRYSDSDDYVERISVFFWVGHMSGEWYYEYLDELAFEGNFVDRQFSIEDPSPSEVKQVFNNLAASTDENDIIFLYLHGYGQYGWFFGHYSWVELRPAEWYPSYYFKAQMDRLSSTKKFVMACSSFSGEFINAFDAEDYLVMTCTDIYSHGHNFGATSGTDYDNEEMFSDYFFDMVQDGYNSYEAFYLAQTYIRDYFENDPPNQQQNPQISDRCDINFFGNNYQ
ncbi:MAG: hypothetical protein ACFE8B_11705, partial [Candidatus Hermodarchaeota archaeon]